MKIKVCSFNLRTSWGDKGTVNDFNHRKARIETVLRTEDPDLIGFQEVDDEIRSWLKSTLCDVYEFAGCGREKNYRGECALIAYRKDRFEALETKTFWLSSQPNVPGSTYGFDQSVCPRVTTAAHLKCQDSTHPFWFYNTHLDHVGKMARLFGAMQILQDISIHSDSDPFVLTGDFNAYPDAPEIKLLQEFRGKTVEATRFLTGTFHGYEKETPQKIDYIFTDFPCDPTQSYLIKPENINGTYISDHCPVFAYLDLSAE